MIDRSNRIRSLALVAVLVLCVHGMSYAGELIHNGGFESGLSGWEERHIHGPDSLGVIYSTSTDTRPDSAGVKSLQIDTTKEFTCPNWIRQAVRGLRGGSKYRMSIWYKVVAGGDPAGPIGNVVTRDMKNDTNQDRIDLTSDLTTDGVWKHISREFVAHASTTPNDFYRMVVNLYPRGEGGAGGTLRVDDFSLWDLTAPEPEAGPAAADAAPVAAAAAGEDAAIPGEDAAADAAAVAGEDAVVARPQTDADRVMAKLATPAEEGGAQGAEANILDGFPYLRNERVVYLWSRPENGGGLLRVRDLASGHEVLGVAESKATWWRVDMKRDAKQRFHYDNAAVPCEVLLDAADGEGKISFRWPREDVDVEVETRLASDEALARSRISVNVKRDRIGLLTVTFPVVTGILPFSEGGKEDRVLQTAHLGRMVPSPLASGKELRSPYPIGATLPLTALMGEGIGLYLGEEDGEANRRELIWTPDAESGTLAFSLAHPVLDWGGDEPVRAYSSPGDVVTGPFHGDWFDVALIYRKWAITAPWCRKGPIHERDDYPQWLARVPYWTNGGLSSEDGIEKEIVKSEFFGLPETVCHDYYYMFHSYQHDRNPEYFPPRIGSENYIQLIKDMHARGIRVVPYVIGWLWNMSTESYRTEDAERRGAMCGPDGSVYWTWAGGLDPQAAMCPATDIWREKMFSVSTEMVGRYGFDGVYYDYFTVHCNDCFVKEHGHAVGGGNYWTKAVHEFYEGIRAECRKLNPEVMLCGEDPAEWCIDVLDTMYDGGGMSCDAPVYLAVYHGYTHLFGGGIHNRYTPPFLGRWWLMGGQNGRSNQEHVLARPPNENYRKLGPWYRDLIRCHWEFARPWLAYGRMLRPPKMNGNFPSITVKGTFGPMVLPSVEGTAWLAPDGTVGVFFLNYDGEKEYEFTWTTDLNEIAGLDGTKKLNVTRWSAEKGEEEIGVWAGGVLRKTMTIEPWGMIALKLEVVQ